MLPSLLAAGGGLLLTTVGLHYCEWSPVKCWQYWLIVVPACALWGLACGYAAR